MPQRAAHQRGTSPVICRVKCLPILKPWVVFRSSWFIFEGSGSAGHQSGSVSCRVLKHALSEVREGSEVNALVYVGDCMEEPLDELGDLAGQLKLSGVPIFIFQEGNDPSAYSAFSQIAELSGGAHSSLDRNSASQLGLLLNAVAVYAAGGREAFDAHCRLTGGMVKQLGKQLK